MPLTREVLDAAPELAAGIVRDWSALASTFGWSESKGRIDQDHLVDLIGQLAEAALHRDVTGGDASVGLLRTALEHGRDRRADGFSEEMLLREYHLLRRGLWENLKRISPESATETILRIDGEITMATAASLRGFHQEEGADEDALIEQIARNWGT